MKTNDLEKERIKWILRNIWCELSLPFTPNNHQRILSLTTELPETLRKKYQAKAWRRFDDARD